MRRCSAAASFAFISRPVISHFRDCAARHGPEIQARHAAIGVEPTAIFFKELAVDAAVVIDHAQSALDGEVIVAENIGPLQAKQQDHLRRPYADALQTAQPKNGFFITHVLYGIQAERA